MGRSTVEEAIEVGVPAGVVFEALQDVHALPLLLDGVMDARPLPHATLLKGRYGDQEVEWEVHVVDEADGRHITWDRLNGPGSLEVRLRPAGPRGTRVTVLLYEADDEAGGRLRGELAHFRQAIATWDAARMPSWGVGGPW